MWRLILEELTRGCGDRCWQQILPFTGMSALAVKRKSDFGTFRSVDDPNREIQDANSLATSEIRMVKAADCVAKPKTVAAGGRGA